MFPHLKVAANKNEQFILHTNTSAASDYNSQSQILLWESNQLYNYTKAKHWEFLDLGK